jgi:hypothetical protein
MTLKEYRGINENLFSLIVFSLRRRMNIHLFYSCECGEGCVVNLGADIHASPWRRDTKRATPQAGGGGAGMGRDGRRRVAERGERDKPVSGLSRGG